MAVLFPVLLWVAVRCRPVFAATASFIVGLAVLWSTTFNMGHFGDASIPLADRILAAQTFVLVGALLALILAALFADRRRDIAERKRAEENLRALNAELDHRAKNLLATVSAIITQTQEASRSHAAFVAGLQSAHSFFGENT